MLSISDSEIGDVYNILETGANYVWTAEGWDKLSETIDFTDYYTKEEIDKLLKEIKGDTI